MDVSSVAAGEAEPVVHPGRDVVAGDHAQRDQAVARPAAAGPPPRSRRRPSPGPRCSGCTATPPRRPTGTAVGSDERVLRSAAQATTASGPARMPHQPSAIGWPGRTIGARERDDRAGRRSPVRRRRPAPPPGPGPARRARAPWLQRKSQWSLTSKPAGIESAVRRGRFSQRDAVELPRRQRAPRRAGPASSGSPSPWPSRPVPVPRQQHGRARSPSQAVDPRSARGEREPGVRVIVGRGRGRRVRSRLGSAPHAATVAAWLIAARAGYLAGALSYLQPPEETCSRSSPRCSSRIVLVLDLADQDLGPSAHHWLPDHGRLPLHRPAPGRRRRPRGVRGYRGRRPGPG